MTTFAFSSSGPKRSSPIASIPARAARASTACRANTRSRPSARIRSSATSSARNRVTGGVKALFGGSWRWPAAVNPQSK